MTQWRDVNRTGLPSRRLFLQDTRLLYLSGTGGALGNSSGLVGRNLMLDHSVDVLGVFEDQLHGHRGRSSTHAFTDFRVPSNRNQPIGGIVVVTTVPYLIQQQARPRDRLLSLNMYGEDAPQPTNTVDRDPAIRDVDDDPPSSGHIMGTLRFGGDPAASVCRRDGRFHDIGNLYGTGASLFPTSSGFNPTLTITMLATYVAAAMVSPDAPERALD